MLTCTLTQTKALLAFTYLPHSRSGAHTQAPHGCYLLGLGGLEDGQREQDQHDAVGAARGWGLHFGSGRPLLNLRGGAELVTCLLPRPCGGRFWETGICKAKHHRGLKISRQAAECPVDLGWGWEPARRRGRLGWELSTGAPSERSRI